MSVTLAFYNSSQLSTEQVGYGKIKGSELTDTIKGMLEIPHLWILVEDIMTVLLHGGSHLTIEMQSPTVWLVEVMKL